MSLCCGEIRIKGKYAISNIDRTATLGNSKEYIGGFAHGG
jgi:hypothetical protein